MKISIADEDSPLNELANLFSVNLTAEYISHSELQSYRAVGRGLWSKNITSVLQDEIRKRLCEARTDFPTGNDWCGVIQAYEDDILVGLALVTITRAAAVPFGVIEDIVIDRKFARAGRGEALVRWIFDKFQRAGVMRIFLESGINNQHAHHFFEQLGFSPLSVVMMRDLNEP